MGISYNTKIVQDGLALHIDAANVKSYPGSGTTWYDLKGNTNFTLNNPIHYSYDSANNGSFDFNRTLPPDTEDAAFAEATGAGSLSALTYLGNDHTTEVWYKINNRSPTNYNSTETSSAIFVYTGFHAMFYYNASSFFYLIWGDNNGSWSNNGASFGDASSGVWQQLVGTREGNNLKIYLNSELKNTTTITRDTSLTPTSNRLRISSANNDPDNFSWNADVNVSVARMYTRALSNDEILRNFEAMRGRYGI